MCVALRCDVRRVVWCALVVLFVSRLFVVPFCCGVVYLALVCLIVLLCVVVVFRFVLFRVGVIAVVCILLRCGVCAVLFECPIECLVELLSDVWIECLVGGSIDCLNVRMIV